MIIWIIFFLFLNNTYLWYSISVMASWMDPSTILSSYSLFVAFALVSWSANKNEPGKRSTERISFSSMQNSFPSSKHCCAELMRIIIFGKKQTTRNRTNRVSSNEGIISTVGRNLTSRRWEGWQNGNTLLGTICSTGRNNCFNRACV